MATSTKANLRDNTGRRTSRYSVRYSLGGWFRCPAVGRSFYSPWRALTNIKEEWTGNVSTGAFFRDYKQRKQITQRIICTIKITVWCRIDAIERYSCRHPVAFDERREGRGDGVPFRSLPVPRNIPWLCIILHKEHGHIKYTRSFFISTFLSWTSIRLGSVPFFRAVLIGESFPSTTNVAPSERKE